MNDQPSPVEAADEDYTVRLLRLAGSRPSVSDERAARVRAAVHPYWRVASRRRAIRTRIFAGTLLLAAAAALIVIVDRAVRVNQPPGVAGAGEVVAIVERVAGEPVRVPAGTNGSPTRALLPNDSVRTGEWIETDGSARVALRLRDGRSVRLDVASRVRPLSPSVLELSSGAVYVDTGQSSEQIEVRTPLATAHDVGTQFEVRLIDLTLRLRVRTGVVELRSGARSVSGRAGTEVTFSAAGTVSRPVASHGPEWNWIDSLAPPVDMDGVTLSTFLERLAHEQGWDLRYGDAVLAREASGIVLHGSVNGLAPADALDVAIATSGLQHRLENGTLTVLRGSAVKDPR